MQGRSRARLVYLDECVTRAAHRPVDAFGAQETPCERGLSRSEVTGQIDDRQPAVALRICPGKPPAEGFRVLSRLCFNAHPGLKVHAVM